MPHDVNLKLAAAGTPLTAVADQAAVETEGGFLAWVTFYLGTITDSNETVTVEIQASRDGAANYFPILSMEVFTNDDENKVIRRPCYVPRPAENQTKTYVRLACTAVAGTTPSLPVDVFLDPMLTLGVPDEDENHDLAANRSGAAYLYT